MSSVQRVVVVGRDAPFWLSVLSLHRALGSADVTVRGVELPSALSASDAYSAAPSLAGLHALLGLDRHDVLRAAGGLPAQGQRFNGWGETSYIHGYDGPRAAIDDVDILHFWIRGRGEGLTLPYDELSVAAAAARQGRVAPDGQEPLAFGTCHRGYHLEAQAYAGALKGLARSAGIQVTSAACAQAERHSESVRAVVADGERIEGDLFIDASGPEAVLAGNHSLERWGKWFPADRLISASLPRLSPYLSFADISAVEAGWIGFFPLRARTAVMAAFSSQRASDTQMLDRVAALAGRNPESVRIRAIDPGTRRAWRGNVVAIGESFTTLEPLDAMQLHLVHAGLSNLIAWFPPDSEAMPEATSYNAVMARYAAGVRDYMIAHYRLNARTGQPLWDQCREADVPATLQNKLDLFDACGLVRLNDEETFEEASWSALFLGQGLVPAAYNLQVDRVPMPEQVGKMSRLLERIAELVRAMPTVEAYLQR